MMEGFNNEWTYSGTRRFATYTNLKPGSYRFRIKGANSDGLWNNEGISIKIRIIPPFWQTPWFRILLLLIITGSIWSIFHLRLRSIKKQKYLLEKQVDDRTRELAGKNTG